METRTTNRPTRRLGRWVAGGVAVAAVAAQALISASTAHAAQGTTVQRFGFDIYLVLAADGRANNITISDDPSANAFFVEDTGDVIVINNSSCTAVNRNKVSCPRSGGARITLDAGDGDDRVTKSITAPAVLIGGLGNDTISTTGTNGADLDVVSGGPGNDTITGGGLTEDLVGGPGDDTLNGNAGQDQLDGGLGNDRIFGGAGDDRLESSDTAADGADVFDGGDGSDTVSYSSRTGPLTVTLDGVANDGAPGEADNNIRVESVTGGQAADTLTGSTGSNVIFGGPGNDTIDGLGGIDLLLGEAGNDSISGGPGATATVSDSDFIEGGPGIDTVHYDTRAVPLTITIDAVGNDGAAGENDNVRATVENVVGGSAGDTVTGSADANVIDGANGNDRITGGAGTDTLSGGAGDDTINGVDQVAFNDELDGGAGAADTCIADGGDDKVNCEL
jgi:Ca2+-binding RTX toxin-like protein